MSEGEIDAEPVEGANNDHHFRVDALIVPWRRGR